MIENKFTGDVVQSGGAMMLTYLGEQYLRPDTFSEVDGKRTKSTHPYNYDPILQFLAKHYDASSVGTEYTDRLLQFDLDKCNRLMQKHFGDAGHFWGRRDPKLIESFLRDWIGNPALTLIAVIEYCNQATGYPTWRLDYSNS